MTPKELQNLDGKLRRTCYAIVKDHLLSHTDIISKDQVKKLAEGIYGAMIDALDDSIAFMEEYDIIKPMRKRKKTKKR